MKMLKRLAPPTLLFLTAPLLIACAPVGGSATEQAICNELRVDLPSYSTADTAQTLADGDKFMSTFEGVCS